MKRFSEEERLHQSVAALIERCFALERKFASQLAEIPPAQQASAHNLIHYLSLRQHDLRPLQALLASHGLSSLGRTEAHVLASLRAVAGALTALKGAPRPLSMPSPVDFDSGPARLEANAERLLGSSHSNHSVRVLVTMPSSAATDYALVSDLVGAGMDIMRINCAHDDARAWLGMVENLQRANKRFSRRCRVLMDLGGPKLRTGRIGGALRFRRLRPARDALGRTTAHLRVLLVADRETAGAAFETSIPLRGIPLDSCRKGDVVRVIDTRGRWRKLRLIERDKKGRWAESARTLRLLSGAPVTVHRGARLIAEGEIGELPETEQPILLQCGDVLEITRSEVEGRPAVVRATGQKRRPATVPITLDEAFEFVKRGERVFLDDGKFRGVVQRVSHKKITVLITEAPEGGGKLRSDKGVNLPDTQLKLPALTDKDLVDLEFVARHADMVGMSFVRDPADVEQLQQALRGLQADRLGIVLKIENRQAFENLPRLLLRGLKSSSLGVMVARGDLAVEVGYERLAEVQEEILWLCEAAHVPVIWATQVLETMARTGTPSRPEVTDAAMSGRAECVMLNKGPCIVETVRFLENVLKRMERHQHKKSALLRHLSISDSTRGEPTAGRRVSPRARSIRTQTG
jgi:pyruvate kinase